jgi:hypothetical protein
LENRQIGLENDLQGASIQRTNRNGDWKRRRKKAIVTFRVRGSISSFCEIRIDPLPAIRVSLYWKTTKESLLSAMLRVASSREAKSSRIKSKRDFFVGGVDDGFEKE